ncbi:ATP-binding cassette sub-family A member 3-like [Brachionus plicatilis]|uniref:ATP-binding cassette sub-family A member 3-like n=1 Tax=Brachionus plicatilis TaxID=10195 RepID=A0A3M7R1Z6_BRAPC|nr:ATP-binding cassette sub-family A member 3-like [Brachionus plicatilis]
MKERKVVGFFRQFLILFWKNWVLFKRNIAGTITEICASLIFVIILLILRFFVDSTKIEEQNANTSPIFDVLSLINATTNRTYLMYYPNNSFIEGIVTNAFELIKSRKPVFSVTGN